MNRSLVVATALLVPALVFVSCKDSNRSSLEPGEPEAPGMTSATKPTTAKSFSGLRKPVLLKATGGVTAQATGPAAHDPQPFGPTVVCLDGEDLLGPGDGGTSRTWDNGRGCEVDTYNDDLDGSDGVAGLRLSSNGSYTGKLLTDINNVDARYAGGTVEGGENDDDGSSTDGFGTDERDYPYFQIPIDECESSTNNAVTVQQGCDPGFATDGFTDAYAYINVLDCNDSDGTGTGDHFTGAVKGQDDPTCEIFYDGNFNHYDNWNDFEDDTDLEGARIARRRFDPTTNTNVTEHILFLSGSDDNYFYGEWHGLVHRLNIK